MGLHPTPCLPPCSVKTRRCFCGWHCLCMCAHRREAYWPCVCFGLRGDMFGWCRPWIQLCLSEKCLAFSEGKPEPQEGQQGPRDPADRKLTPTLVHLPNIHSLEISLSSIFFSWKFFFLFNLFFKLLTRGKVMLSMHTFFSLSTFLFNITRLLLNSLSH